MNIEERYKSDFSILIDQGHLVDEWSQVYNHCKLEGRIAQILSGMLKLSEQDTEYLTRAAILHDWYKRFEIENKDFDTEHSYTGLIELGVSKRVCDIAHSVGHSTLPWIENSNDLLKKIMHFIDDIVAGTDIVSIRERVEFVRKTGTRNQLAEDFRSQLSGRSFFDVQIEVGERLQHDIENMCSIEHGILISVIKQKYEQDQRLQATS